MASFPCTIGIEKFPAMDLSGLREDLMQSDLDSRQVAEVIRAFLTERGYGVSFDAVQRVASNVTMMSGSLQRIQETLETVAVLM